MIYLDNSATTRPFGGVIDVMDRCMREQYFNASAAYKPAVDVDRAMRECRKTIAAQIGIQESGVIFTGGDAKCFAKRIKNTIFANCNLVFCGLDRILEYNASEEHLD